MGIKYRIFLQVKVGTETDGLLKLFLYVKHTSLV